MTPKNPRLRRRLTTTALLAGIGLGAGVGAASIASAATGSTTTTAPAASAPAQSGQAPAGQPVFGQPPAGQPPAGQPPAGAPDPATMAHGPGETLLTGSDLTKATAAAEAAQPGATVVRAETDSSGTSTYEVHMKKSDGTYVTVHLDSSFTVTSTDDGFGPGPVGGHGPKDGQAPPAGQTPPTGQTPAATR